MSGATRFHAGAHDVTSDVTSLDEAWERAPRAKGFWADTPGAVIDPEDAAAEELIMEVVSNQLEQNLANDLRAEGADGGWEFPDSVHYSEASS